MSVTVVWQLTRTCDLACAHCMTLPARAQTPELTTYEAYRTVDQIALFTPERFVISGGDPLARTDIFELVQYARRRGMKPAVNVSPTRRLTADNVNSLRANGLTSLIFSINGSSAARHDAIGMVPESFSNTVRALRWARDARLGIEINTVVTRDNVTDLAAIAEMIDAFRIDAWNVHFLVPLLPAWRKDDAITAEQAESAFAALAAISSIAKYRVRVVEAPEYRRYLSQKSHWADFSGYIDNTDVVDDVVFITADGDVRPSEFLPLSGGNLRELSLKKIVKSSDLFVALRDRAKLSGKCKRCDYRSVCGGSRARAFAVAGDMFASDPLCAYEPLAVGAAAG